MTMPPTRGEITYHEGGVTIEVLPDRDEDARSCVTELPPDDEYTLDISAAESSLKTMILMM